MARALLVGFTHPTWVAPPFPSTEVMGGSDDVLASGAAFRPDVPVMGRPAWSGDEGAAPASADAGAAGVAATTDDHRRGPRQDPRRRPPGDRGGPRRKPLVHRDRRQPDRRDQPDHARHHRVPRPYPPNPGPRGSRRVPTAT